MNDKIYSYLISIIHITLLVSMIASVYSQNWYTLFITTLTFILVLIPNMVKKKYNIKIPIGFHFAIVIFIYAALFLGEITDFYNKFWWWDIALHIISATALGLAGFIFLLFLYQGKKIKAKPFLISVFAFSFSLSIGALWEIFEFIIDATFGTNMLKSGLLDTIGDLVVNLITEFEGLIVVGGTLLAAYGRLVTKAK